MEGNPETAKRALRLREMAQRALDALGEVDLDHVPVERIAEAMGISRATFFRMMQSKDQVVVFAFIGDIDEFASKLSPGSLSPGEPVWPALRRVFQPLLEATASEAEARRRRLLLLKDQPKISARLRRARVPQVEALALALAEQGVDPAAASVLSAAAVSTVDRCIGIWATSPGTDLIPLIDQAFFHLERGF